MTEGPPPQFKFSIGNAAQPHIIYVSDDPAANHLQISVTCSIDATLAPGTLVPPSQAGGAANSLFYVDLTPLGLDAAAFAGLQVTSDGWDTGLFTDEGQQIGLSPAGNPIKIQAGVPIVFTIGNFVLPVEPTDVTSLNLHVYHVDEVATGPIGIETASAVTFAVPPGGKADLATALALTVTPSDGIVVSVENCPEVENSLTLTLSAVPNGPAVSAGPSTLFTLSVVYSADPDGFGALMTTAEGKRIDIPQVGDWVTQSVDTLSGRIWQLTPAAGKPLLSGGTPLSFTFEPVATYFQAGPTVLLLEYENVPGFADGAFAFTIQKLPHVFINSFSVEPATTILENGAATVTASWDVSNFGTLVLDVDGIAHDVSDLSSFPATISQTTAFQLIAGGASPGGGNNVAIGAATAAIRPVIENFAVRPSAIYAGDCSPTYSVELSWDVVTNENVAIEGSLAGPLGQFPPRGRKRLDVAGPQIFTLTATGGPSGPTVRQSCVLWSLTLAPVHGSAAAGIAGACFSPAAPIFALSTTDNNSALSVTLFSTSDPKPIASAPVGSGPGPPAFSPEGATLLVPGDDVGQYFYAVTSTAGGYTLLGRSPLYPGSGGSYGYPGATAVGPVGKFFVTYGPAEYFGGKLVVADPAGGSYQISQIALSGNPGAAALTPDGGHLFVASPSYSGSSIFCVAVAQTPPTVTTQITSLANPSGIAITPDGSTLLVADSSSGTLYAYEIASLTSPPKTLAIPAIFAIAILPHCPYALVAARNGALGLVNYARWSLSTTASLGWAAPQIAVSPDGSLALVINNGASDYAMLRLLQMPAAASIRAERIGARALFRQLCSTLFGRLTP